METPFLIRKAHWGVRGAMLQETTKKIKKTNKKKTNPNKQQKNPTTNNLFYDNNITLEASAFRKQLRHLP